MDNLLEENARLREEIRRLERDRSDAAPPRSTIVGMVDMLLVVGFSGRIADLNSASERFFGIRRDEVLGLPVDVLSCAPLDGPALRKIAERAQAEKGRVIEILGSGADTLAVNATPVAQGVQLLISERQARRSRLTLDGYFSAKVMDEIGRNLVDPTAAQRRVASVVIVQLRSRDALPAEAERELRNEWLEAAGSMVLEAGATLDSSSGGRLTSVYGVPLPVENHEVWALNTALRIKEAHRALTTAWIRRGIGAFDAGIGIDCGDVTWADTGLGTRRGFGVTGPVVERATALALLAPSDQILTTTGTFDAVRSVLERRPEMLWRPVKFKRSEVLRLRSGEDASTTIHISD